MTLTKDPTILASFLTGILGFFGIVFGLVFRGQNRQIATNREAIGECVTDKQSIERFEHVTEKMGDFKEDITKLFDISTEQGKSLASIDTKLDLIVENSARRRSGD